MRNQGKSGFWKKKTWRTLAVSFLTLAIVFSMLGEVAGAYASALNYALHTTSYKVVDHAAEGGESSLYYPSTFDTPEEVAAYGRLISEAVEAEGLVLMKNRDGALPLPVGSSVSPILQTAYNFSYGASGSGAIDAAKYDSLRTALESAGLTVNATLWDFYAQHESAQAITYNRKGDPLYKVNALSWSDYSEAAQASIAQFGGTALVVVGRLSGEGADDSTRGSDGYDGSYLSLSAEEIEILSRLTALRKAGELECVVVLLNTAQIFQTAFLEDDWQVTVAGQDYVVDVDACLWVGNVGIGGIHAVAKALTGEVNPSGRLPDTYVKDNFSSPAATAWVLQNSAGIFSSKYEAADLLTSDSQGKYGVYLEGIYVGYRYYETRYEDVVLGAENVGDFDYAACVSRPFGYGLSYTDFVYSDFAVRQEVSGDYSLSVTVSNAGFVAGRESVLAWLQKPYTDYDRQTGVEKASVELAGFEKTDLLAPGASQTLTISVPREYLKTYDAEGYGTYILEPGDYYLALGASAHDALNNILAAKGKTPADGMDAKGNPALAAVIGQDISLDTTTYAVSSATGTQITNRLDFADINKYEGRGENAVTYVSRGDWAGTFPQVPVSLAVTEQLAVDLQSQKPLPDAPEAEMPAFGVSSGLSLIMMRGQDFDDPLWQTLLDQMTWEEQTSLVMLAGYGTFGAASIALPEIKAEDGPTGVVDSAESISFPSEGIWAATFNCALIQQVGDALAEDARGAGVEGMYLPGVNIHRTPFGGRTHEYFSEDPFLSGTAVAAEVQGVQAKGVTPYVKHYVFNDEEDARIGIGIWLGEQAAREIYLRPFEYAVAPSLGNAHGVMSSFNRAGALWTSASSVLLNDILRGEFGFDGVVLTDMALGQNAYMSYDAIAQGTDLFLDPTGSQSQFDAYAESQVFRQAVRQAVHRYLYVMVNYSSAMNGVSANSEIIPVTPWWQLALQIAEFSFCLLGGISAILLALSLWQEKKRKDNYVAVV